LPASSREPGTLPYSVASVASTPLSISLLRSPGLALAPWLVVHPAIRARAATRAAPFPPFDDVKRQLKQRIEQTKLQQFQEDLRGKAKTDYKFAAQ